LCIPLACTSSSSMPMIRRFFFLMESLSSCIFLFELLSLIQEFFCFFFFFNIYFVFKPGNSCLPLVLICWSGFHPTTYPSSILTTHCILYCTNPTEPYHCAIPDISTLLYNKWTTP
jgi:hypothetical protein